MFYEETWINDVLHFRTNRNGHWYIKLYDSSIEARDCRDLADEESLHYVHDVKYAAGSGKYILSRHRKLNPPRVRTENFVEEVNDSYLGDFTQEELANITAAGAKPKYNPDPVNHPRHYTNRPSGVECIQVVEHMGFNLGNAIKYIWRADEKEDTIKDLKKAKWYIERELKKRGVGPNEK